MQAFKFKLDEVKYEGHNVSSGMAACDEAFALTIKCIHNSASHTMSELLN